MLRYTTEEAICKMQKVHHSIYDYSKFLYTGYNQKGIIICEKHGEFLQTFKMHTKGEGCKKCGYLENGKKLNKGLDYYMEKVFEIHKDTYNYNLLKKSYTTSHAKYDIICKKHGIFSQTLSAHIHQKAGCPLCYKEKRHGINMLKWAKNSQGSVATLYLIEIYNDTESFLKIGVTYKSVKERFCRLIFSGYNYKELAIISIPHRGGKGIAFIEMELHLRLKPFKYKPLLYFKGKGECYKIEYLNEIIKAIQYEIDLMRYNLMIFEDLKENCYDIVGKYADNINTRSVNYKRIG